MTYYAKLASRYIASVDGNAHASAVQMINDAETLLWDAMDLFDGTHALCDNPESPEWIWRWRVLHLLDAEEAQP